LQWKWNPYARLILLLESARAEGFALLEISTCDIKSSFLDLHDQKGKDHNPWVEQGQA
jgi:hypothetical protein